MPDGGQTDAPVARVFSGHDELDALYHDVFQKVNICVQLQLSDVCES